MSPEENTLTTRRRRAPGPAGHTAPDTDANPPAGNDQPAGREDEHAPDQDGGQSTPAGPVRGYRIAEEAPVRAGGYVLTERGWQLDPTTQD